MQLSISAIAIGTFCFFIIGFFVTLFFSGAFSAIERIYWVNQDEMTNSVSPSYFDGIIVCLFLTLGAIFFLVCTLTGCATAIISESRVKSHCFWVGICLSLLPQIILVPQFCLLLFEQNVQWDNISTVFWIEVALISISILMVPMIILGGFLYERLFDSIKPIIFGVAIFIGLVVAFSIVKVLIFEPLSNSRFILPLSEIYSAFLFLLAILIPIFTGYLTGMFTETRVLKVCILVGIILSIATFAFFMCGDIINWLSGRRVSISIFNIAVFSTVSVCILPLIMLGGYFYEKRNLRVNKDASLLDEYLKK